MNQENNRDKQTDLLADLEVTTEQAEQTKAGNGQDSPSTPWFVPNKVEIITVERSTS
jgi:hypothetical protein